LIDIAVWTLDFHAKDRRIAQPLQALKDAQFEISFGDVGRSVNYRPLKHDSISEKTIALEMRIVVYC
jgi:hypothetical protein